MFKCIIRGHKYKTIGKAYSLSNMDKSGLALKCSKCGKTIIQKPSQGK